MLSSELPKVASKVPPIKVLREKINYGENKSGPGLRFWKHLKSFRQTYETVSGARGDDFFTWEDERHMEGLKEMVDTYLHLGDGATFWPDDKDAEEFNALRYLVNEECEYITSTLVQIFYQLNTNRQITEKRKQKTGPNGAGNARKVHDRSPRNATSSSSKPQQLVSSVGQEVSQEERSGKTRQVSKVITADPAGLTPLANSKGKARANPYTVPSSPISDTENAQCPSQTNLVRDCMSTSNSSRSGLKRNLSSMASEKHAERAPKKPMINKRQTTGTSKVSRELPNSRELLRSPKPVRGHPPLASDEAAEKVDKAPSPIHEQRESSRQVNTASQGRLGHQSPGQRSEPAATSGPAVQDQTSERNTSLLHADMFTDENIEAFAKEAFKQATAKNPDDAAPLTGPANTAHTALGTSRASPLTQKNGTLTKGSSSMNPDTIDAISRTATPPQNPDLEGQSPGGTYPYTPWIPVAAMLPDSKEAVKHSETGNISHVSAGQSLPPTPRSGKGGPEGSRAKVNISFILIHSRARWRAGKWCPKGKFLRKSLDELMAELPVGFARNAPGLMFRVIGSGLFTEQPIAHGDSLRFDMMTNNFGMQMDEAIRKYDGPNLSFEIEIEGLRDDYIDEADDVALESDVRDIC